MKRWAMRWYQETQGCMDCRLTDPFSLTFDHVRGTKEFYIGGGPGQDKSWPRLWAEIQKCDVVCFNCHLSRERKRKPLPPPPIVNEMPLGGKRRWYSLTRFG